MIWQGSAELLQEYILLPPRHSKMSSKLTVDLEEIWNKWYSAFNFGGLVLINEDDFRWCSGAVSRIAVVIDAWGRPSSSERLFGIWCWISVACMSEGEIDEMEKESMVRLENPNVTRGRQYRRASFKCYVGFVGFARAGCSIGWDILRSMHGHLMDVPAFVPRQRGSTRACNMVILLQEFSKESVEPVVG